jgi:hypothetical protein
MNKRLLFGLLLIFGFFGIVNANTCELGFVDNECDIVTDSFVFFTFDLGNVNLDVIEKVDFKLYKKDNPLNLLKVEDKGNSKYSNLNQQ